MNTTDPPFAKGQAIQVAQRFNARPGFAVVKRGTKGTVVADPEPPTADWPHWAVTVRLAGHAEPQGPMRADMFKAVPR